MEKNKLPVLDNKVSISLKDFLKKYTAISSKFIDEYYKFYEACEKDVFGIDLADIIKYLNIVSEEKFYIRFKENYKEHFDYNVIETGNAARQGAKLKIYKCTFDTFQKICMRSKSDKANSVRDYFILLYKFIDYYKNEISEMILNKASTSDKYIYILAVNSSNSLFKTGRTNNPRKRFYTYATGQAKHPDVQFIMLVQDPIKIENCIKSLLADKQYKENKEIYKVNYDLLKKVCFQCAESVKSISENKDVEVYVVFEKKV
jgi:phage anti-repressor protein